MSGMFRLPAVPAMILDGFVESVIRFPDLLLTVLVIGVSPGRSRES
jgi:hypothetical protein